MDTKKLKELIEQTRVELKKVAEAEFGARRMGGLRGLGAADEKLAGALEKVELAEKRANGRPKKEKKAKAAKPAGSK